MHHSAKVLIVEDQYFIAVDSEMTLQSAGFDCVGLATSADQAFDLARDCSPDIVLMDIRLASGTDGLAAARHIYRELGIRSIFASGHADSWLREEAQDANPLGWLDKPYTGTELVHAIEEGIAILHSSAAASRERTQTRWELH
jgi:DNA-binding NarL/FixJ family response regulator